MSDRAYWRWATKARQARADRKEYEDLLRMLQCVARRDKPEGGETLDEFMERTKDSGISTSLRRMAYALDTLPASKDEPDELTINDGFEV